MNYIAFVSCTTIVVAIAYFVINQSRYVNNSNYWHKMLFNNSRLARLCVLLCALAFLSPIVYEFRPISEKVQYEISRDGGRITGLIEDKTGFHWPFLAYQRFVVLPQRWTKDRILYWRLKEGDSGAMQIAITTSSVSPSATFIRSNGEMAFAEKGFGEFSARFDLWFSQTFESKLNPPKKLETQEEVMEFVRQKVDEWNQDNPYGFRIDFKPTGFIR